MREVFFPTSHGFLFICVAGTPSDREEKKGKLHIGAQNRLNGKSSRMNRNHTTVLFDYLLLKNHETFFFPYFFFCCVKIILGVSILNFFLSSYFPCARAEL